MSMPSLPCERELKSQKSLAHLSNTGFSPCVSMEMKSIWRMYIPQEYGFYTAKTRGLFNPAWLPQLQLHCQGMYLQADKLTTTSLKFQAER